MLDATHPPRTAVVIEDDPDVRHLLTDVLDAAGFSTVAVGNGIDGIRAVLAYQPLITTIDVTMPGIDGFETARRIRAQSDTYIIMLTALNDEADVILGLTAGADEYLSKPFRPRELRARIDALLRRPRRVESAPPPPQEQAGPSFPAAPVGQQAHAPTTRQDAQAGALPITAGPSEVEAGSPVGDGPPSSEHGDWLAHRDLRLDRESHIVLLQDDEVELTRTEFDLLSALLQSKRRVRSKADLTLVLRGESYVTNYLVGEADKRAVEAHMANLRRKLGDSPIQPRYIETVRGVGYRLTSDGGL